MRAKLFVTLFFDKIEFILLFLLLVSLSGFLAVRQADKLTADTETAEIPDIEIWGSRMEESPEPNESYGGVSELEVELEGISDRGTRIYGMIARNLYTMSSPFYYVSFHLYGAEGEFLERFQDQLEEGRLPRPGRKEVLVGNNAAAFYHWKVGDAVTKELGFEKKAESDDYTVSGILNEKNGYFGNGVYILKEMLREPDGMPEDNMLMIYVSGKRAYQNVTGCINAVQLEEKISAYTDHYSDKKNIRNKPVKDIMLTLTVSFLLLQLVYFYISKGMDKKAGILKALGVSNSRIIAVCGIGFGGLVTLTTAAVFLLSYILLDIKMRLLLTLLPFIGVITFLILFAEVALRYIRIEPVASMPTK